MNASPVDARIIDVDTFARQLITDKCSELIENENLLPANVFHIVKQARDKYFEDPSLKNYEYVKKLFLRTKYMDDSIDYKNFNRRMLLIVFKFALNKGTGYFPSYKELIEVAIKRLNKINPDLKSSPRAMLQHYNECLENLDNPVTDEHHLVTFGKEVATKIFIEAFEFSYAGANEINLNTGKVKPDVFQAEQKFLSHSTLLSDVILDRKRKLQEAELDKQKESAQQVPKQPIPNKTHFKQTQQIFKQTILAREPLFVI
ncbi:hypothetical protein [Epiphyas postvittana nucleopolyhedrovirus]|uniref:Ac106 n=1 Tax=Epiphyas postvittana nucleopolyhedrovirus TaxID=70600 RepID=Q91GG1_NPVEP|nr:hypothetical protein [Epiphyas postvittana nucleopolyhedrovirus]AAK85657.1 unknown [Epiphyas postvittana nucleopolyhedrovirus]